MSNAVASRLATFCAIGAVQSFTLGGMSGPNGAIETNFQIGIASSSTEGLPAPPSWKLPQYGYWRFRWSLHVGINTIQIDVKQVANVAGRPTMVVKANPACGVNADVVGTAGSSATWITIGPITANAASVGAVYVELHNNVQTQYADAFFKNIVVT
jgi:hypothetical protein